MTIQQFTIIWVSFVCGATAYSAEAEVGIVEKLDQTLPLDVRLTNEQNELVLLSEELSVPTVLSFVYYRCPGVCSPLMGGIADIINNSDLKIGQDYQVMTVSFDHTETIDVAVNKKRNYLASIQKSEAQEGWKYYTLDSINAAILTEAAGFKYKKTGNEYLHSPSLIMVTPEGKIMRYLNGTTFLPFEFKMAIIETSKGISGPSINKVLEYCFSYDPAGQRYVFNTTRIAGVIISLFALILFCILALKPILEKRKTTVN